MGNKKISKRITRKSKTKQTCKSVLQSKLGHLGKSCPSTYREKKKNMKGSLDQPMECFVSQNGVPIKDTPRKVTATSEQHDPQMSFIPRLTN